MPREAYFSCGPFISEHIPYGKTHFVPQDTLLPANARAKTARARNARPPSLPRTFLPSRVCHRRARRSEETRIERLIIPPTKIYSRAHLAGNAPRRCASKAVPLDIPPRLTLRHPPLLTRACTQRPREVPTRSAFARPTGRNQVYLRVAPREK